MRIGRWNLFVRDTNTKVVIRRNIPYAQNNDFFNQLDLFTPKLNTSNKALVFVHGGAWIGGSRTLAGRYKRVGVKLAEEGISTAVISYRLANKRVNYKTQVKDVLTAVEWVRRQTEFSDMKMVLCGESAGGHLVSVAALDRDIHAEVGFDPSCIKGIIGIGGVYDIALLGKIPLLKQTIVKLPFGSDPHQWKKASPVNLVHEGAPPFLLINAQWDFHLQTDTQGMETKLKSLGVPVETMVVKHSSHMTNLLGRRSVVLKKVSQFVHKVE